jgi:hypothetical protein
MALDPRLILIKSVPLSSLRQAEQYVGDHNEGRNYRYVREVYRLAPTAGYNPEVMVAQWNLETDGGRSVHWRERNNPGAIGVTDSFDHKYVWDSPERAAQGHLVHLVGYVDGYRREVRKFLDYDPRYMLLLKTDWAATVVTVEDLTGKWATDPRYGEKIAERLSRLRATVVPVSPPPVVPPPPPSSGKIVFGRVPKPSWVDRQIPDRNNWAWDRLGQRLLRGVVYHRQVGTNWGTDGWFRGGGGGSGLTDFGIDHNTGEILQWNDYMGRGRPGISPNRAGWASGPWENPPGDGRAYVAKYGVSAINRDLVSLEIAGMYETPISDRGYQSVVNLSSFLADQAQVPWTNYPIVPSTGLPFTYTQSEFQNHKPCPGKVVLSLIPQIIQDTKNLLKKYQES